MVWFIFVYLYTIMTLLYCPFFDKYVHNIYDSFYWIFIILFFINYFISWWRESYNNNLDLIFIFFKNIFKFFFKGLNYLLVEFKKIYNFIIKVKLYSFINNIYSFLHKIYKNMFIVWRPLFKKTSYFGYFRSNKSKWIK